MDQRNWMQKWTESPQDVRGFVWKESSCQPHVYIHQISLIYHHYTTFISLWYHHFFQEKKRPGRLEVWIPLRPLRRAQGWTSVARRSPRGGGSGGSEAASDKGGLVYAEPAKIRSLNYTCIYLDENIGKGLWIDSLVNRLWTDDFWTVSGGNWYPTKTQDSYVLTDAND